MNVDGLFDKVGVLGDWSDSLECRKFQIWVKVQQSWIRAGWLTRGPVYSAPTASKGAESASADLPQFPGLISGLRALGILRDCVWTKSGRVSKISGSRVYTMY
jgi:hypothetical protein